ncbi:MAG: RNA polymerase sigma factor [Deltaproteobacteria bacterium]|nr:RNA polymerase sigma factor [Deltaproteobacteria bacterium]
MPEAFPKAGLAYLPGGQLTTADDATLASAMMAGDVQAPRVAWTRFAPMVHRMLKRTFGPTQDVDDMVQDVFLTLFRKVGGLREPKSLKAFVIAITAMTIKYELRQRRVRRWIYLSDAVSELEGQSIEQPDAASRQALRAFYAILDRLSAHDRTAFVLRFFEGLELTDVAGALGISVSTTKRHLVRIWRRVTVLVSRAPELETYLPRLAQMERGENKQEIKQEIRQEPKQEPGQEPGQENSQKDRR